MSLTNEQASGLAIDALMDALDGTRQELDFELWSCDGDVSRQGCYLTDAFKVAESNEADDLDASTIPSNRIAVMRDNFSSEWCVWDGNNGEWMTVSGLDEHYNFNIRFRGEKVAA